MGVGVCVDGRGLAGAGLCWWARACVLMGVGVGVEMGAVFRTRFFETLSFPRGKRQGRFSAKKRNFP